MKVFGLIGSNYSKEIIESINDLILNLSLGMILSTIFFIIVVLLPELLKRKSTLNIIQPRLNTIGNEMNQKAHYFVYKRLSLNPKSFKKLKSKDFENITGLTKSVMDFKYEILGSHGSWVKIGTGNVTELESFSHHKKLLIKKIDEIFALPTITQIDDELIGLLAKIRDCELFIAIEVYEKFNNEIYEYYKLLKQLKKYFKPIPFKVRK